MRRAGRIALWLLVPVAVLAAVVAGGFVWLRSASGLAYVVRTIEAAAKMPGLEVKVVGLEGALPFEARIAELRVSDRDGTWLVARNVSYDIAAAALTSRRLLINELVAQEIAVSRLPISETPPPETDEGLPLQLPAFDLPRLPVAVALERLSIERVSLAPEIAGTPIALTVSGRARLDETGGEARLNLDRLDKPGAIGLRATASGSPMILAVNLTADEPGGEPIARMLGRDQPMPARIELNGEGPLSAWRGRLQANVGTLNAQAEIRFDQGERWRAGIDLAVEPGDLIAPEMVDVVGPRPTFGITIAPLAPRGLEIAEIRLDTAGLKMSGAGVLGPERLDFAARLGIDDLKPFSGIVGQPIAGKGEATLRLGGTEARPELVATLAAEGLGAAEATVGSLQATLDGWAEADPGAKLRRIVAKVEATAERITAPGLRETADRAGLSLAGEASGDLQTGTLERLSITLPGLTLNAAGAKTEAALKGTFRLAAEDIGKTLAMVLPPTEGLNPRGSLTVEGGMEGAPSAADITIRASSPSLRTGIAQADGLLARGLKLDGKARWNGDTATIHDLTLTLAEAKARINGTVAPMEQKLALSVDASLARLGAVADGVDGALELDGKLGGTFAAPSFDGRLIGRNIASGGVRVDRVNADIDAPNLVAPDARLSVALVTGKLETAIRVAIARERDGMHLRDLVVEGAGARLTGNGVVNDKGQFIGRIQGRIPDLAPWSALAGQPLTGAVDLDARASAGRGQNLDLDLNAQSIALGSDPAAPRVGRARVVARLQDLPERPGGQLDLTADQISAGTAKLATLKLALRPTPGNQYGFTLATTGTVPAPVTIDAAGTLSPVPSKLAVELSRLNGTVAGERLALRQPLRAAQSGDAWIVSPFILNVGSGSLAGSGRYDPRRVEANLTARRIALAFLSRLGELDPLLGTVDADVAIAGPQQRPTGKVGVAVAEVGFAQASPLAGRRISGRVDATLGSGETQIQGSMTGGGGTRLGVTGTVPVTLDLTSTGVVIDQTRPLRLKATGNADLGSLADVIPLGEDRLTGKLALDMDVSGTVSKPLPRGSISLSDARYVNQLSGVTLEGLTVDVRLDGQLVTVSRLTATDGERGRLDGRGRIDLAHQPRPDMDIAVTLQNFRVARRDDARVLAQGEIHVVDNAEKAAATGTITITNAELRFPERLPPSIVVLDVTEIDSRKAPKGPPPGKPKVAQAAASALALDINVVIPRQAFVRGRGLDSEWNGRLHVGGTSARPAIAGNLGIVRGSLDLLNRDFKLARGSLTFDGIPEINPRIDLLAETTAGGITAQVLIGGTPRAPTLTLTSSPPLPQDEVLARVLFDKNVTSITPIQGIQLAAAARQLAGGGGFDVMDKLRSATGLDRLSVNAPADSSSGLAGTTVSGGKYIGNGVYVGVDQGTTGASTRAKVEIEVTPRITVDSTFGTTGQGVGLNYKFDY